MFPEVWELQRFQREKVKVTQDRASIQVLNNTPFWGTVNGDDTDLVAFRHKEVKSTAWQRELQIGSNKPQISAVACT